jgi:hypothetical protein
MPTIRTPALITATVATLLATGCARAPLSVRADGTVLCHGEVQPFVLCGWDTVGGAALRDVARRAGHTWDRSYCHLTRSSDATRLRVWNQHRNSALSFGPAGVSHLAGAPTPTAFDDDDRPVTIGDLPWDCVDETGVFYAVGGPRYCEHTQRRLTAPIVLGRVHDAPGVYLATDINAPSPGRVDCVIRNGNAVTVCGRSSGDEPLDAWFERFEIIGDRVERRARGTIRCPRVPGAEWLIIHDVERTTGWMLVELKRHAPWMLNSSLYYIYLPADDELVPIRHAARQNDWRRFLSRDAALAIAAHARD